MIHTMIFTHFFDSESGKNYNFEGSKQEEIDALRLRDHFDFVLVWSLILLVGWNHNYSELCSEDVQSRNVNTGTMGRYMMYYMPMCPDFDAVAPWLKCTGDGI